MATSNNSNTNNAYTYIKGTVGDIIGSRKIILYKHRSGQEKISITNLDDKLNEIYSGGEYVILERNNNEEPYRYNKADENNILRDSGFNTIIYINSINNQAVGYSEFLSTQGIIPRIVLIKLDNLLSELTVGDDIEILNVFDSVRTFSALEKNIISDELYGFTTIDEVYKNIKQIDTYPRYVQDINSLLSNPNNSVLLDYGLCTVKGLHKLNLIKEMTIANGFEKYQLGYYRGEIVLYAWKFINSRPYYFLASMSRKDKFGNSIIYTNTTDKIKPLSEKYTVEKINYFSGKYASVVVNTLGMKKIGVLNLETDELLDIKNHVIDVWNPYSQIIELPNILSKNNLTAHIPEISSLYIDIKNYNASPIEIVKKVGDWFVFRETAKNLDSSSNSVELSYLIYTNFSKTIRISEDYDKEPILINNNLLLVNTNTVIDGIRYNYNTYFTADGDYCTENYLLARDIVSNKKVGIKKYSNNVNCILYSKEIQISGAPVWVDNNAENYRNYRDKKLLIDYIGDNLLDSYIFGFRRNSCSDSNLQIPEIIGAINGLVYYKEGNKIKLL